MRGFINKLFKLLNLGGRDWVVFLLALLLAFSTWVIHKLSLDYSVYLTVEVEAVSNIENRSDHSVSGTEITARCKTTGWRILYAHMTKDDVVKVKFPASFFVHDMDDRFYISSDKLHEYADRIFGSGVSIEYFVTDKVYFRFQEEESKKVPVKAVTSLTFKDQYIASGSIVIAPETVTVYGDRMHLDALEYVTTATIKHTSIDEDFSGMISLTPINGMRFSVDEVHYKMDVTRYLEVVRKDVPITIEDVPADKEVVIEPPVADVVLNVVFPLKADPKKDLTLKVSYDDLKSSLTGLVMIEPASLPLGVIKYDINPVAVRIVEVKK